MLTKRVSRPIQSMVDDGLKCVVNKVRGAPQLDILSRLYIQVQVKDTDDVSLLTFCSALDSRFSICLAFSASSGTTKQVKLLSLFPL